jgi:hypothetical protein
MSRLRLSLGLVGLAAALSLGCDGRSVVGGPALDAAMVSDIVDVTMDAALMCPDTQRACAGRCVDLRSDRAHCGACGVSCSAGNVCQNGACVPDCMMGETLCMGAGGDAGAALRCVSLRTDRTHCGACGNACGQDQVCSNGMCTFMCTGSATECMRAGGERYCADVQSDRTKHVRDLLRDGTHRLHGRRAATCRATARTAARAATTCAAGRSARGRCVVSCPGLRPTAPARAATCRATAPTAAPAAWLRRGQVCSAGVCVTSCATGQTDCRARAATPRATAHCGTCGMRCPAGSSARAAPARRSCGAGLTNCNGVCRNPDRPRELRRLRHGLRRGAGVLRGHVRDQLLRGPHRLHGLCRDLSDDNGNCGACGTACPGAGLLRRACAA